MYKIIVVCAVLAAVQGMPRTKRQTMSTMRWRDCGTDPERPMIMEEFSISPMPIEMPGSIRLTLKARTTRVIQNIDTHVTIQRRTFFGNITIPCFAGLGSCSYEDACGRVDLGEMERDPMGRQVKTMFESKGVQFRCPIQPTDIELRDYEIELPDIPMAIRFAAEGTYLMRHYFTETGTGRELGCFISMVSVQEKREPCENWWECLG
jgi:ganglioside GM2 activator